MAQRRTTADRIGVANVGDSKSDYTMAKRRGIQTRVRRGVPSQGAGADYHYRNESDWLWMQELAHEIYRNHMVVGSVVDRAVEYQIGDGFNYQPMTGDLKLDADLKAWCTDWTIDPNECSPDGESVFVDQEETALRSTLIGGDIFALPVSDGEDDPGSVALLESQFCRSGNWNKNKNVFHGIEMAPATRRRINYYFTSEPISPNSTIKQSQLTATPAYYYDDITQRNERNVFHVRMTKRANQTRGITAFAPLFTPADYQDDIEYLEMVHKRAASLFAFVRTRQKEFDPAYLAAEMAVGTDVTNDKARDEVDASNRQYREVAPGTVLTGLPGETINISSPNIPNAEHFTHQKMLLTYIGINLGMPLVMVLMDASQTNFSGIRGAVDMARNGFRRNQRRLITKFHCPYLRFKLLKYAERDRTIRAWVAKSLKNGSKVNIFSHWWQPPTWPYIQPVEDATADMIRDVGRQTSPRRRMQERGMEWSEVWPEIVEDWSNPIIAAKEKAKEINAKFPGDDDKVSWRDIFQPPLPERVNVNISDLGNQQQAEKPNTPSKQPSK